MGIFASFQLGRGKHENGYYTFIMSIKICALDNLCSYFCTVLLYLLCFLIHIIEREIETERELISSAQFMDRISLREAHMPWELLLFQNGGILLCRAGFQGLQVGMVKPTGAGIQTDTM